MIVDAAPVVLVDANVLYSAALRDLIIALFLTDTIEIHWSSDILDEMAAALVSNRRATVAGAQRLIADLTRHFPEAAVVSAPLPATVTLPDPRDHHVLGAAMAAQASILLTFDLNDFPATELAKCGPIQATHPDVFFQAMLTIDEFSVIRALAECRRKLVRKPMTPAEHVDHLDRCKLTGFAAALRQRLDKL